MRDWIIPHHHCEGRYSGYTDVMKHQGQKALLGHPIIWKSLIDGVNIHRIVAPYKMPMY